MHDSVPAAVAATAAAAVAAVVVRRRILGVSHHRLDDGFSAAGPEFVILQDT